MPALDPDKVRATVLAIIRQEGADTQYSVNSTILRKCGMHNPGHITWSPWCQRHGAQKVTLMMPNGKYRDWAGWPTRAQGEAAIVELLKAYTRETPNITVWGAIHKYAPVTENDPAAYARNLSEWAGVTVDTRLRDILFPAAPTPTS